MKFINESGVDRIVRVFIGLALITLGLSGLIQGISGTVVLVIGFVPLITGIIGFCPLYTLLGFRTNKA